MVKALLTAWLLVSASMSVQTAWGQKVAIVLDPGKTEIHWILVGNVHTTHGTFHLKRGHVNADVSAGMISGELVVDSASGDSGNASRDNRMNKEVLESDRFPEFRFIPKKLEGPVSPSGHSSVRITGEFTIHGSTHGLTTPIDIFVENGAFRGSGKFSIPYVDWGMKDPSNFLFKVDKSVELEIVAIGQWSPQ